MRCKSATAPATVIGDEACANHWATEKIQVVRRSISQETCHASLILLHLSEGEGARRKHERYIFQNAGWLQSRPV